MNNNIESWAMIIGHENYYVSSFGRVMNIVKQRELGGEDIQGYHRVVIQNKKFLVHRLVAEAFIPNPDKKPMVDHIDGNRRNNHVSNLRWATNQENQFNSKKQNNKTSHYKGVSRRHDTNRWRARIVYNGRKINVGSYKTAEEAGRAYDDMANELFGEFAKLNFPEEWE